jgi:hypothetical protein
VRAASPVLLLFLLGAGFLGASAPASAETCTCGISLYSVIRWMAPWWGLECVGHCGHCYVGSSCDTAHTAGCGSMTGYVRLRYSSGSTIGQRDCPDDHTTCFRGPSTCDDDPGSWGNVCSADCWRCRFGGDPDGSWDCNYLWDIGQVHQLRALPVVFEGACGTSWFNVLEYIDENDPVCCDDPMGYLSVSTWTKAGSATTYLDPIARNCNGGSQGGVSPHCGTFGATLAVLTSCFPTIGGGSGGGGEDDCGTGKICAAQGLEDQRSALAKSIARREQKLAETRRERVEAEVAERARALGVGAPVTALTDLLYRAEAAALARDKCRVEHKGEEPPQCRELQRELEWLDVPFSRLSGGMTIQEFRSGSALLGPPPAPASPALRP